MIVVGWMALVLALAAGPPVEVAPPWTPPGLVPSTATLGVLPPLSRERRSELLVTTVGSRSAETRVEADGRDERFATTINGAVFESGERDGIGWTRTPWGLTHLGTADDQGDPLDRWPRAVYGYDRADCTVVGQTAGPQSLIVIRDAPPGGVPHWFYVDPQNGAVVREIQRRGVSQADFTFASDGSGWTVSGGGPDARVERRTVPTPAEPVSFDPPASRSGEPFASRRVATTLRFVENAFHYIELGGTVNGRRAAFLLDSGTNEIVISGDTANRVGVHPFLDHGLVNEMNIGGIRMHDVPVQVVDGFGADVILGYDFFVGHIVHVDYKNDEVSIVPHAAFSPPARATRVATDLSSGAPLVAARFFNRVGSRFLIDIGSPRVLLSADFASDLKLIGFHTWRLPSREYAFLEGAMTVRVAEIGSIDFGGASFDGPNEVTIEIPTTNGLPLPLDGVLGTDLLGRFDLWFDDDAGITYMVPR